MIEKLARIEDETTMNTFCNLHSSYPYNKIEDKTEADLKIFRKCNNFRYFSVISSNYSATEVIDLYKISKNVFFLQMYIYSNLYMQKYKRSIEVYNILGDEVLLDKKNYFNIVVAYRDMKNFNKVIELSESTNEKFILFERAIALTRVNRIEEAKELCKALDRHDLDFNENIQLKFLRAEVEYRVENQKKLKSILTYLENNYLMVHKYLNIRSYLIAKYYLYLGNTDKYFIYSKKAAYFETGDTNDMTFKIKAIKTLQKKYNMFLHRSFEEESRIEDYLSLKNHYIKERRNNNTNYVFE